MQLRVEKARACEQLEALFVAKARVDLRVGALESELVKLESLKGKNALLRGDKELLQGDCARLTKLVSAKDRELGVASMRKATLEAKERNFDRALRKLR